MVNRLVGDGKMPSMVKQRVIESNTPPSLHCVDAVTLFFFFCLNALSFTSLNLSCSDTSPLSTWYCLLWHDIVYFGPLGFNPVLPHGFKRPYVGLRSGHTHIYSGLGLACFRCGTYVSLHTQSFRVSAALSLSRRMLARPNTLLQGPRAYNTPPPENKVVLDSDTICNYLSPLSTWYCPLWLTNFQPNLASWF